MTDTIPYAEKHIEAKLSQIGAKVAQANELSVSAKVLCEGSAKLLADAQTEIADLYESLGDVCANPCDEKGRSKVMESHRLTPAKD